MEENMVDLIIHNCKIVRELTKDNENQINMSIELFNIGKKRIGGSITSTLMINCDMLNCTLFNDIGIDSHMNTIDFQDLNEEYQNRVNHFLENIIKNSKFRN
jgi:hypothetical protein